MKGKPRFYIMTVDNESVSIDDQAHELLSYLTIMGGDGLQCNLEEGDDYYEILRECRKIADAIKRIEEINIRD